MEMDYGIGGVGGRKREKSSDTEVVSQYCELLTNVTESSNDANRQLILCLQRICQVLENIQKQQENLLVVCINFNNK